jgi:hypothetical protein
MGARARGAEAAAAARALSPRDRDGASGGVGAMFEEPVEPESVVLVLTP